jgi:hypothetical protein
VTTLVCQTLVTELSQEIVYSLSERVHVGAFLPYLYMHGAPVADFTFSLTGPNGLVFSKTFTCAEIKTALGTTDNYAHVFYPIVPANPVQIESGTYTATLTAPQDGTYTVNDTNFLAWIQQHEDLQASLDYETTSDEENPFTIRFKSYKEGVL